MQPVPRSFQAHRPVLDEAWPAQPPGSPRYDPKQNFRLPLELEILTNRRCALELAAAAGKSVVIHQRDSWEDTIELLRKYSTRVRAVMHCFDAGLAQAQEVVDLGHFVSFTGIVTFENASEVREAAKS